MGANNHTAVRKAILNAMQYGLSYWRATEVKVKMAGLVTS